MTVKVIYQSSFVKAFKLGAVLKVDVDFTTLLIGANRLPFHLTARFNRAYLKNNLRINRVKTTYKLDILSF